MERPLELANREYLRRPREACAAKRPHGSLLTTGPPPAAADERSYNSSEERDGVGVRPQSVVGRWIPIVKRVLGIDETREEITVKVLNDGHETNVLQVARGPQGG